MTAPLLGIVAIVKRSNMTVTSNKRDLKTHNGRDGQDGRDGSRGRDGQDGKDGSPGPRGRDGLDGLPGPKGIIRPPGPKGDTGVPGTKGEGTGGIVYVRWGHNSCPDNGAQLVYTGRVGGAYFNFGGGGNPQCLPLNPQFYNTTKRALDRTYIYGAEYKDTDALIPNSHNTDVVCAVCHVPTRNALYMIPAKYDCPSNWTREYFGFLMSEHFADRRSQFTCVDRNLISVVESTHNHDGFRFFVVEGTCIWVTSLSSLQAK